jgi:hypothetical protein
MVDGILDVNSVEETEESREEDYEVRHQECLKLLEPLRKFRGTGRRRTGNRVDDVNFSFRTTRQIRLDNGKHTILNSLPKHHLGNQTTYPGHTAAGMYIGGSDPRRPFKRKVVEEKPVRVTGGSDGATIRKCMVLNSPIRRWDESHRDFVDFDDWWKPAGPPPGTDTLGIGPRLAAWEVNAEILLD